MIASLETKGHFIPDPNTISKQNEVKINRPLPHLPIYKAIFFKGDGNGGQGEVLHQFLKAAPPISFLINITHLGGARYSKGPLA